MSARRPIPTDTRAKQREASDPRVSAWVSAHAGSGKTHVLTQRVVRLLLARVPPSRILCLTYTKAAAANMATRVFDLLAKWALLDDAALTAALQASGVEAPSAQELVFARRLFARTVETPGGLKIQTIHAFCERLLHLFPFEANVPAGFRVVDEMRQAELLARAKHHVLAQAAGDGALAQALARVAEETSGAGFDDLLKELLHWRYEARLDADAAEALRARLGLAEGETIGSVEGEIFAGLGRENWPSLSARLRRGGTNDGKLADALDAAFAAKTPADAIEFYREVFFKKSDGEPRGLGKTKIISKGLQEKEPGLLEALEAERDRLPALLEKRAAAATLARSQALLAIGGAVVDEYERLKRYRGLFDFDDLIERTKNLLLRSNPSWVLYKLDQQIDHILLDEAQDTSAPQWSILESIAQEFCAGEGARRARRSFFAVGDEKQSIFSFQGAAPEKFDEMRRAFQRRFAAAGRSFCDVRLTRSFRSSGDILKAVDIVFAAGDNRRGLAADPAEPAPEHLAWKSDVDGLVEIWDVEQAEPSAPPPDWRLPLDYVGENDPAARLAQKIARKIKALLAPGGGEYVEDKGALRPVAPGDILILVRKRGGFFEAVIRALKTEGVPVAGADRLDLAGHIAVMDLVALGRLALLGDDDLTLATVLKSPLVGLTDDDLLEIAPGRAGSLFAALAASANAAHKEAAAQIETWARAALTRAPFDFFTRILGPERGREKLLARLGPEANDAIDEFLKLALAYERDSARGLAGFLATVETLDLSIKRDMESAGGAVRVMTVHASKGLEAKIVFLPDTCGAPSGRHDPKLFDLGEHEPSIVWSTNMKADAPAVAERREALRQAAAGEYQRLLYVALTRAEERLYVAGFCGAKGRAGGCWYDTIRNALEPSCRRETDALGQTVLRRGEPSREGPAAAPAAATAKPQIPAYARTPAPPESAPAPPLRPSNALMGADAQELTGAASPAEAERLLIGRLTHALLQHLPRCAADRRAEAAQRFLELRAPLLSPERRDAIAQSARGIIEDARLAPLFGAASAAEVDIVGRVATAKGALTVSGRIDRLAETETEVYIADFKSRVNDPPAPWHLRQLALYRTALAPLYPRKRLRCVLIATQTGAAVEAEGAALDAALARIAAEET